MSESILLFLVAEHLNAMIGDFDDDLFAVPKEKPVASNSTYEVKSCPREASVPTSAAALKDSCTIWMASLLNLDTTAALSAISYVPKWYTDDHLADSVTDDKSQVLKFRADSAYRNAEYSVALACYHQLQDNGMALPSQMTREVIESIGLCYLKLEKPQQALQWGLRMWRQSRNRDHRVCSLTLLAKVYHQLKQHDNEVLAYVEQLRIHPLAVFIWAFFGEALTFYWGIPFSEPMTFPKAVEACNRKPQLLLGLSDHAIRCLVGACFIRVRLIVEMGKKRFSIDSWWTYDGVLNKAEHWINGLQLSEEFQRKAEENMSHDMRVDQIFKEEDEQSEFRDLGKMSNPDMDVKKDDHAAMFPTDHAIFFKKWFGWMDSCLA